MDKLKLIVFDADDLAVVSAHLQDAVLKVGDMAYLPNEKRFAALINRFDWSRLATSGQNGFERRRSALRFERVLGAKLAGIDLRAASKVLSLLAIQYDPKGPDDPAGTVTLLFAGDAAIRLEVECIEAELRDLGAAWKAKSKPAHPDDSNG